MISNPWVVNFFFKMEKKILHINQAVVSFSSKIAPSKNADNQN